MTCLLTSVKSACRNIPQPQKFINQISSTEYYSLHSANFKVYYWKNLVSQWIHELNKGQEMRKINIKEAIEIVADAWDSVKPETIKNCWLSTKILPAETTLAITDDIAWI